MSFLLDLYMRAMLEETCKGGDKEVSRNAMSKLFHNLSWQALTNDNDSIQVQFEAVTALAQSINRLI